MPRSAVVLYRAAHMAFAMLQATNFEIYTTREGHPILQNLPVSPVLYMSVWFPTMWAQLPNRVETMGENTTPLFSPDLQRRGEEEVNKNGKNNSTSIMWELLPDK